MKGSLLQLSFGLVVLILCAGFEELLPKAFGVGFPLLLTAVQTLAAGCGSVWSAVVFAAAAGAAEDALSGLPPMTSVSYFLAVAFLVGRVGFPRMLTLLTYPCYRLWLAVWSSEPGGGIFLRLLLSFPIGIVTAAVVGTLLVRARGGAAVDEEG